MTRQTIFITGAASGIGRATALQFHARGWFVGATDVDQAGLDVLKGDLDNDCFTAFLDVTDKAAFDYIRSYSPYDNVEAKAYPPMLWTAGLNDPRVTYWEPAKMVAKLRAMKTDDNVLLLKTNMGAGHGGKSDGLNGCAKMPKRRRSSSGKWGWHHHKSDAFHAHIYRATR